MKVKESDLVIGDKYYLPETKTEVFFIGCFEDGFGGYDNYFYTDEDLKNKWFLDTDGTIPFSMDNEEYFYEEVE